MSAVKSKQSKSRPPRLTRQQAFGAFPVRNQAVSARRTEEGETEITLRRREDWVGKIFSLVLFVPKERRIVLETIGTDVWDLCDGNHSVAQIADRLVAKHKLTRREAEASLAEYLRRLGKKQLIGFVVPKGS